MSLREAYIESLKNRITPLISLSTPEEITKEYHDEFSYNAGSIADLDVTVRYLPGQIQSGVVQYPGELLIAVKEKYYNSLIEALTTFTTTYNENVISFTELNEKYREYYTTPNVIGVFQNGGIENYVSISISFSLITFTDVLGLDSLTLRYNSGFSNKETIKWLNFNVVYAGDGTSNSGLNGDNYSKETIDKGAITYTFTFVPKVMSGENQITTRNLMFQALTGKYTGLSEQPINTNAKYELGLTMGDLFGSNNAEYVCNCVVKSCTYNQEANGLPTLQVTLTRGDT